MYDFLAYRTSFDTNYCAQFCQAENAIQPYGLRMKSIAEELGTSLSNIQETMVSSILPWTIKHPEVILDMHNFPKKKNHPLTFLEKFQEILENFYDYTTIYMDRSKSGDNLGYTTVNQKETPFTYATESELKNSLILSDLLSVLSALEGNKSNNPMIIKILQKIGTMNKKRDIICWIPEIKGNCRADLAAKMWRQGSRFHIQILRR